MVLPPHRAVVAALGADGRFGPLSCASSPGLLFLPASISSVCYTRGVSSFIRAGHSVSRSGVA